MNESVDFDGAWRMQTGPLAGFSHLGDSEIHAGERMDDSGTQLGLLLTGVCGGGLDLLIFMTCWCSRSLSFSSLTVFQVSLIVSRILQLMSSMVMVIWYFGYTHCHIYCYKLYTVWYASRRSGTILHLFAAMEFMLSRKKVKLVPRHFQVYWTLPVVLTVGLICLLFHEVLEAAMFFGALLFTLTGLMSLIYFVFTHRSDSQVIQVLVCAYFAFATYLPSFMIECLLFNNHVVSAAVYTRCLCASNLRLLVDGYVCWLAGRKRWETAQQPLKAGNVNLDSVSQIPD